MVIRTGAFARQFRGSDRRALLFLLGDVVEELRQRHDGEEHGPDGDVPDLLPQLRDEGAVEAGALDDRLQAVASQLHGDGRNSEEDR